MPRSKTLPKMNPFLKVTKIQVQPISNLQLKTMFMDKVDSQLGKTEVFLGKWLKTSRVTTCHSSSNSLLEIFKFLILFRNTHMSPRKALTENG